MNFLLNRLEMIFKLLVALKRSLVFSTKNPEQRENILFTKSDIKDEESSTQYKKVFRIQRKAPRDYIINQQDPSESCFATPLNKDPSENRENSGEPQTKTPKSFEKILSDTTQVSKKKRDIKTEQKQKEFADEEMKEKPADDISETQDRKRKKHKTTEFFYLLERKALRMMRRYYKEELENYASKYKYKQNLKRLEKHLADQYFREYIDIEFAKNKDTATLLGKDQLLVALQTIILCDRYNKNEKVTEGLDFDEIRSLLNKYNSKNLKDFFKNPCHAFLYAHYHRLSSKADVKNQSHVDQDKLIKQMESLFKKSLKALPDSIKTTVTQEEY